MSSNKKTFKQFHKDFDAYLLRTPNSGYMIGYFAEQKNRFFLDIDEKNIIGDLGFSDADWRKYQEYLRNKPYRDANFPVVSMEREFIGDLGLNIPGHVNQAGLGINTSKIVGYQFGNVKARVLDDTLDLRMRTIIEDAIEDRKGKERRELKKEVGNLKRTTIISTLYYADEVSITVEKENKLNAEAEAKLMEMDGVKMSVSVDSQSKYSYSFTGNASVPFAANIMMLKDL